jgi:hypothetical protein
MNQFKNLKTEREIPVKKVFALLLASAMLLTASGCGTGTTAATATPTAAPTEAPKAIQVGIIQLADKK